MVSLPHDFDLIVISMGSLLVFRTVIEQPERIRRVVLIAPAGGTDLACFGAGDWRSDSLETARRALPYPPRYAVSPCSAASSPPSSADASTFTAVNWSISHSIA